MVKNGVLFRNRVKGAFFWGSETALSKNFFSKLFGHGMIPRCSDIQQHYCSQRADALKSKITQGSLVEIKVNNPHANLEKTINSKESPAKAKTKILEEDEGTIQN